MSSHPESGRRVLYVITCAIPAARDVSKPVTLAQASDWTVCVIATPMALRMGGRDIRVPGDVPVACPHGSGGDWRDVASRVRVAAPPLAAPVPVREDGTALLQLTSGSNAVRLDSRVQSSARVDDRLQSYKLRTEVQQSDTLPVRH